MVPLVDVDRLTKRYENFTALADCVFQVARGEVFGLLGPNGAGKTTLLRLLLGFLKPTSGTARIDGLDCVRESVNVRKITAYLPGDARLFPSMKGSDVLQFFTEVRPEGNLERAKQYADRLELDLTRRVAYMSTGMRQKLALAGTLAAQTPLVILDEPTANLDPNVRSTVVQLVLDAKREGRTVIFSSHVMSEVEEACDRVVILRRGQLVHTQTLADLRRQHRIRARLIGKFPPAPAEIAQSLTTVRLEQDELLLESPGDLAPLLGWLATLPLADLRIEPVGLRAVYDRYHAAESDA